MKRVILPIAFAGFVYISFAQEFDDSKFTSLILEENQTIVIDQDSLLLDTLIMRNDAKLKFLRDVIVVVRHAYFDEKVTFDLKGSNGTNGKKGNESFKKGENGTDGTTGRNIELIIEFETLGSLTVDTRGGKGGKGGDGYSPKQYGIKGGKGRNGGDSGAGGVGQSGGQIKLSYLSPNFLPLINQKGDHSIKLITKSGDCGGNGKPGRGEEGAEARNFVDIKGNVTIRIPKGARGRNGRSTGQCKSGIDGEIVLNKLILERP
jgi:hypothetical protein